MNDLTNYSSLDYEYSSNTNFLGFLFASGVLYKAPGFCIVLILWVTLRKCFFLWSISGNHTAIHPPPSSVIFSWRSFRLSFNFGVNRQPNPLVLGIVGQCPTLSSLSALLCPNLSVPRCPMRFFFSKQSQLHLKPAKHLRRGTHFFVLPW